jgi:hypothetical protein
MAITLPAGEQKVSIGLYQIQKVSQGLIHSLIDDKDVVLPGLALFDGQGVTDLHVSNFFNLQLYQIPGTQSIVDAHDKEQMIPWIIQSQLGYRFNILDLADWFNCDAIAFLWVIGISSYFH